VGVARLELTELVGRVAWLRYLFEPAAGGRGVAETVGESTRASSSTANRRPGWPPRSVQVSTTTLPCALHCPAWRLADVFDACGRPRVQEMVSEDLWHLFFRRRALDFLLYAQKADSPLFENRDKFRDNFVINVINS